MRWVLLEGFILGQEEAKAIGPLLPPIEGTREDLSWYRARIRDLEKENDQQKSKIKQLCKD